MKTGLKIIGASLAVVLFLWGGWFYSNYRQTLRMPPEQAAIEVAKRFETGSTAATAKYTARHINSSREDSDREKHVFVVTRDGKDAARVAVSRFLRVGWQQREYERIQRARR